VTILINKSKGRNITVDIKAKLIVLSALIGCSNVCSDTLDIAALDFCPYVCSDTSGNESMGFVLELEKLILERAGHRVNFHIVPYLRSLKGTESGEYDAVAISNDSSSKVNICSKNTIGPMIYTFYVKKDMQWRYSGLASLGLVRFGVIAGYDFSLISPEVQNYFKENRDNEQLIQVHHGSEDLIYRLFKKLELGRIDTFSEAAYVADYKMQKYDLQDKFEKAGQFDKTLWGRMCFSPKNPKAHEYAQLIDTGMKELRKSGELKKIMQSYGLSVWEPQ
jgi:polar amino acid transport system substrate-binding protein